MTAHASPAPDELTQAHTRISELERENETVMLNGIEHMARIAELENMVASLREALTTSGSTKFAYIGEFKFTAYDADEQEVSVPWTTIKQIMKAIIDRANSSIPRAALAGREEKANGE